ncbi:unnamed protein product [Microthlaspi erraticum]|uniref:50S ribosomal protein L27 n=1 Tax=Microthlaspi erraticum TaxID=1685480 RepID=A0A6D2ISA1_9BRAS|nr:unnamed protein product [Microthlaspi erraticum]
MTKAKVHMEKVLELSPFLHAPSSLSRIRRRRRLRPHLTSIAVYRNRKFPIVEKMNFLNSAASICRRVSLRELITEVPAYGGSGISDSSSSGLSLVLKRWATKKTAGSTKNGRDSKPKNLGVKKFGGENVIPGNIIVRQRGTRFHPGDYVGIGKDHTLFALKEGRVRFEKNKITGRKWIHVDPKDGHVLHPIYAKAAAAKATKMETAQSS